MSSIPYVLFHCRLFLRVCESVCATLKCFLLDYNAKILLISVVPNLEATKSRGKCVLTLWGCLISSS